MCMLHVVVKANGLAYIPSRSFRHGHKWDCPSNTQLLSRFNKIFPLSQGACWQLFLMNTKIVTRVISILLINQLALDVWCRLPPRGRICGESGMTTSTHENMTPSFGMKTLTQSSVQQPALLDRCGQVISEEGIKLLVQGSRHWSGPLARPVSWTLDATPYTGLAKGI